MSRRRRHALPIAVAGVLTAIALGVVPILDHHPSGRAAALVDRVAATSAPVAPPAVAQPAPARDALAPCATNGRPQLIVVSIRHQHAWACARHRTVISTPVTTGASERPGDATPRGAFAVQGLDRNTRLTTSADRSYDVKYWLPFHLGVWGFHDASWQRIPFGSPQYRHHGSHGCVHVPLAAMRALFHWVHYGTVVRIR